MVAASNKADIARLFELLSSVVDPEIPVLTLQDLGVLRDISVDNDSIKVTITPTYAGCPAMDTMRADIETTLAAAGYEQVTVQQSLSPAWTTDWMSENGRKKLRAYGIAPPVKKTCGQATGTIECPQCGSGDVKLISEFGSTACKALYQCQDCLEPFDYFKCI
jgi:ring-1,2-phenylacetyl-CoA epoxidase subunit PaaD